MTYFELFEIPVSLTVDTKALTRRFFELQKKYHPDFFGQATDAEKEEALELSSMINKAWKTFQSQEETVKYVLTEKGLLEEEEKYQLPPDFLMEVMELNELKMDGVDDATLDARVQGLQKEITEEVSKILSHYSESSHGQADLLKVKDWYYKKKYLDRLLADY
jgi:molecular chaperone HscB